MRLVHNFILVCFSVSIVLSDRHVTGVNKSSVDALLLLQDKRFCVLALKVNLCLGVFLEDLWALGASQ